MYFLFLFPLDDHARFKGDDVIIKVSKYTKLGYGNPVLETSMEFLPASFDTLITFEGLGDDNIIEIKVANFTVPAKTSSGNNGTRVRVLFIYLFIYEYSPSSTLVNCFQWGLAFIARHLQRSL